MFWAEGEEAFCDKFTSEIMITGYCILGLLVSLRRLVFSFSFISHHNKPTLSSIASFYLAAHGRNGVLSSLYSIWIVLWSSLPLPRFVCHCSWWVSSMFCMMIQLFFTFVQRLIIDLLQHIRLTLPRGVGRKTEAKQSNGSLPPSYIIFATMQRCGSTRGESARCIYLQLLQVQCLLNVLLHQYYLTSLHIGSRRE
jgi:hypothetical protein